MEDPINENHITENQINENRKDESSEFPDTEIQSEEYKNWMEWSESRKLNLSKGGYKWLSDNKMLLRAERPIVEVPVYQEIRQRDKIIYVPEDVHETYGQKIQYEQEIKFDVPVVEMDINECSLDIPVHKSVHVDLDKPHVCGYVERFMPKWDIRKVPRPFYKYVDEPKSVEVPIPVVSFNDKIVERQVVVDTIEKRVEKIIYEEVEEEVIEYEYQPVERIVYVEKMIPEVDVVVEATEPLIKPKLIKEYSTLPPVVYEQSRNDGDIVYIPPDTPKSSLVTASYIEEHKLPENRIE